MFVQAKAGHTGRRRSGTYTRTERATRTRPSLLRRDCSQLRRTTSETEPSGACGLPRESASTEIAQDEQHNDDDYENPEPRWHSESFRQVLAIVRRAHPPFNDRGERERDSGLEGSGGTKSGQEKGAPCGRPFPFLPVCRAFAAPRVGLEPTTLPVNSRVRGGYVGPDWLYKRPSGALRPPKNGVNPGINPVANPWLRERCAGRGSAAGSTWKNPGCWRRDQAIESLRRSLERRGG